MPRFGVPDALRILRETGKDIPFIVVSGSIGEETAVECMKAGAWDYILKNRIKRLGPAVIGGLEQRRLRREQKTAEDKTRRSDEALRESEERYRQLVDSSPYAISVHQDGKIVFVNRAAQLTKDLLLFSRKRVAERKPVDLNEVVGKAGKFLKRIIGEDVECKTELHGNPIPVSTDSQQLEQVLLTLATNARDAMPDGGSFTVRTEQVDLSEAFMAAHSHGKPGPYGMITVSDTGAGMDDGARKRIFDPFYTTKEVGKGTGLGLAVAYGIIRQHDGFIEVHGEPGKGTTFKIYLPVIASEAVEEETSREAEPPARGMETILLAEDNEQLRKLFGTVLTQFGYTVIEAVDGADAVRKFTENKDTVQLLLFDLIMPRMNGKEAHDEIAKLKPGVKTIFASGYSPDIARQKAAFGIGVSLINKPVSPADLLKKVRSVLDGGE